MTNRQRDYLFKITKMYIETGMPIASKEFLTTHNISVSSATVRAEMNFLEKEGYLTKAHTSSGRIPTSKGYKLFAEQTNNDENYFEEKLKDVLAKRRLSIDITLDEAAKVISDVTGLTLVTSNHTDDELLKSIQLTPLTNTSAIIVLVTSSGRVESKLIELTKFVDIQDVKIAIRLFKERLIDTPLRELSLKMNALEPILSKSVKNYENVIQAFVKDVFDFHNNVKNKVYGGKELIKHEEIKRKDLSQLVDMIESNSIWKTIEGKIDDDDLMKIDIRSNNTSIVSKKIQGNKNSIDIAVIGSNRLDYPKAKQAIYILEKIIKGE